MGNYTQSRLVTLLKATAYLLDRPHNPVTGVEMMRELDLVPKDTKTLDDTQRRAFERIKEELRDLGVPLDSVELDGQAAYRICINQYALRDLKLTTEEELVLSLLGEVLAGEESFPLRPNLGLAIQKISAATASPLARRTDRKVISGSPDPVEPRHNPAILDKLVDAGSHNHPVSFSYSSFHSETTSKRHVEPYGFFTRKGIWYLVGLDLDVGDIRVFRVSRIPGKTPVKVDKEKTFTVPADFNLKDYASAPPWNFLFEEEDKDVTVEIDSDEFWRVSEFCQAHGRVDPGQDGLIRWRLKVRDYDPLIKWMLPFGTAMHPSEPGDFVMRYRSMVREMLAQYGR